MNRLQLVRTTGILLIFLVVLLNVPYSLLIQTFEYDDILRKPVDYVLTQFHAGGARLILTWFVFGLAALLFIPTSILLHKVLDREDTLYLTTATFMGAISGILQAVGLMRWVFVVPILANLYTDTTASTATREAVSVVYQAVHQYGGVVIGEHLGQFLLIGWTLGVGMAMRPSPLFKSWVAWWGLLTTPLLLLGQSELLATVIPAMPVVEATPVGFILWEIWLLIVGISLLRVPQKRLIIQTRTDLKL
ncbi:hypothetical protein WA1_41010 [Scytonema hofmannii PCC 7110]|uniref:DUF4386 domain-containing protein n=1 Tax=Scytonema hofmannii PCC 7110 TaxID=128403 RepID=A0A139WUK7_9CYAN|nr:DUF4386 domain-containing protein [Scytonema hofmannii]KYC36122.1 hypothetical protein WA1_41010 [Scytonema hofmannii PCC 7110]